MQVILLYIMFVCRMFMSTNIIMLTARKMLFDTDFKNCINCHLLPTCDFQHTRCNLFLGNVVMHVEIQFIHVDMRNKYVFMQHMLAYKIYLLT